MKGGNTIENLYYTILILIVILNHINKNKKHHITNNMASVEVSIKFKWLSLTFKKNHKN